MPLTFPGGAKPLHAIHGGKTLTSSRPIEPLPAPDLVAIPFLQHTGATAAPLVKKGDRVLMGQAIGEPAGAVSAFVHSSVSGEVVALETRPYISGAQVLCAVIRNDGLDEPDPSIAPCDTDDLMDMIPETLRDIALNAGIVGMGGAAFPSHIKFDPPADKPVDTLILNGAECEPYLTCDDRMMQERPDAIIDGALLIARAVGASRVFIGVEGNKREAIAALNKAARGGVTVKTLAVKYPQGSEKQLIKSVTGRRVPVGRLPMDCGCAVVNVTTAAAFRDAVYEGRSSYQRPLTVSGPGISNPKNVLARIGVSVGEVIEYCGGIKGEAYKVIAGGPMMGAALYDLSAPVVKAMSGLVIFSRADIKDARESDCIRCGRCVTSCPMRIMPLAIVACALREDWEAAKAVHAADCLECGTCTYVCPAKRNLAGVLRVARRYTMAKR